jgi:cytoskeleton protein RodZ
MADNEPAPGADQSAAEPQTLGQLLRRARLAQQLTIEQIATELRIEARQLNALEDDRLEEIGIPVFVKGYLKQYGNRLGVDVRDLLALYYRQTKLADVQVVPNRPIKLRDERQIRGWILAAIVLITVALGLAIWWWRGGSFDVIGSVTRALAPQAQSTAPPPATPEPEPEPAAPAPAAPSPAAVDDGEQPATDAVADVAADADAEPPVSPILPLAEDAGRVFTVPLVIEFGTESWAEVTDSRGERLAYDLHAAGRRLAVRGTPPFAVVLGDARSVRIAVDGEPFELPTRPRGDNFARFTVDIAGE